VIEGGGSGERISLLGRPLPPWAGVRLLAIGPGCRHAYDPDEWTGALVVVERGTLVLEAVGGCCVPFGQGAMLPLGAVSLRAIHNPGPGVTVLSALSRRAQPRGSPT
jgi:hypothetical protein